MSADSNVQLAITKPDPPESLFYIPATGPATRPRRALKHGDSFIVVDSHGDIGASAGGSDGLYHDDTRFLSLLELRVNGASTRLPLTFTLSAPDISLSVFIIGNAIGSLLRWRPAGSLGAAVTNQEHEDRP